MADMEIAQALLAASEQNQLAQIIETHNLGELPHSLRLAINIFEINADNIQQHPEAAQSLLRCPIPTTFGETESIRRTILSLLNQKHS